ncbi:MAG TPA: hypothetical protein VFI25_00720 [Planctomycetota bacterium]|nr:hypothetical protein [Planctomycetota bacterium]
MTPLLLLVLGCGPVGEDIGAWLRALSSPRSAERREAEGRLREALRPEHLPLVEEAVRSGDAEGRRRIARVLGTEPSLAAYLMRSYAAGNEPVRLVAEEALRLLLQSGRRRLDLPPVEDRAASLGSAVLEAEYAGERISRFLEDLNRSEAGVEPVLLDPAAARNEPRLAALPLRGELRRLLEEVEGETGLRWIAFPSFHFLTREPPASGGEAFLRLVRAYESGAPPERRLAAMGLALLGPPAIQGVLAEDVRSGGERAPEALAGLCAPCGRFATVPLRNPVHLERLLRALEDPDPGLRRGAAHALDAIAPSEPSARAACLARLRESAGGVRAALLRILGRCGGKEVRAAIEPDALSSDPKVAAAAIEALTDAGFPPKTAASAALGRRDRTPLLAAAERALRAARPSLEDLAPLVASTDPELRRVGSRLLVRAGVGGAPPFWTACAEEVDPFFLARLADAARMHADLEGSGELAAALPPALAALPAEGPKRLRVFLAAEVAGVEPFAPPADLVAEAWRALRDPNEPLGELAGTALGRLEGREAGREGGGSRHRRREELAAAARGAPPRVRNRVVSALAAFLLEQPSGSSAGEVEALAGGLEAEFGDRQAAEAALRDALVRPVRLPGRDVLAEALDARG